MLYCLLAYSGLVFKNRRQLREDDVQEVRSDQQQQRITEILVSSVLHGESWSRGGSTPHQQQLLLPEAVTCKTKMKNQQLGSCSCRAWDFSNVNLTPLVTPPHSSAVSALLEAVWVAAQHACTASTAGTDTHGEPGPTAPGMQCQKSQQMSQTGCLYTLMELSCD